MARLRLAAERGRSNVKKIRHGKQLQTAKIPLTPSIIPYKKTTCEF